MRVDGLAGHADAQRAAHGRAAAVGRDGVPRADRAFGGEVRGHRVRVLFHRHQLTAELHPPAEFREPLEQDLLCAPLRHHPRVGVRGFVARLGRIEHPVLADPRAVLPDHADGVGATGGVDRVQHTEIVEDLPGARLDPLAARPGEERVGALDDEGVDPAPGEVDGESEAGRSGADDEDLGVRDRVCTGVQDQLLNVVKFDASQHALNDVKLSSVATQRSPKLDKTQVVDTALRLLNGVGLDGLTLRAIAKELNVQAPALYWHFKNKQELLDEMATEMYSRMTADDPLTPDATWRERLLTSNRGLRTALLSHRDGAKVFSGSRFTGTLHAVEMERTLRLFTAAGFTLTQAVRATTTAYMYTLGFVTEEQGVQPLPGERREGYDIDERARRMADFPLSAAAGAEIFEDYEQHFEDGLALVIAGIEARYGMA